MQVRCSHFFLFVFTITFFGIIPSIQASSPGSLDTTFGEFGFFTHQIPLSQNTFTTTLASDMAINSDDDILITGSFLSAAGRLQIYVTKVAQDGNIDATFGIEGNTLVDLGFGNSALSETIAIDDGGNIYVAGEYVAANYEFRTFLLKLSPNGDLDSSFGDGGLIVSPTGSYELSHDICLNGTSVFVVGEQLDTTKNLIYSTVTKYNHNGVRDSAFGSSGVVRFNYGILSQTSTTSHDSGIKCIMDESNRILVAGETTDSVHQLFVMRLLNDGTLDESFGSALPGFTAFSTLDDYSGLANDVLLDLKLTHTGEILILSTGPYGEVGQFEQALTKLDSSGFIDATFGVNGSSFYNISNWTATHATDYFFATYPKNNMGNLILDEHNRILISTSAKDIADGNSDTGLFRLILNQNDFMIDPEFAQGGVSVIDTLTTLGLSSSPKEDIMRTSASNADGDIFMLSISKKSPEANTYQAVIYKIINTVCGDGIVDSLRGEVCDDGNSENADGCSALCQLENVDIIVDETPDNTIPPDSGDDFEIDEGTDTESDPVDNVAEHENDNEETTDQSDQNAANNLSSSSGCSLIMYDKTSLSMMMWVLDLASIFGLLGLRLKRTNPVKTSQNNP